jgi:formate dehydrogenase iron-sulfur subunit
MDLATNENIWDPSRPGNELLDILRTEVRTKGLPTPDRVREIALICGTTAAKVQGVIGYYSELQSAPAAIRVCMGEACRARGSAAVLDELRQSGEDVGVIHCAGTCTSGPTIIRDETFIPVSQSGDGILFLISMDSASLTVGAEEVANELLKQCDSDAALVRTGSRGLYHLEPIVEVELEEGRFLFGSVKKENISSIISCLKNGTYESQNNALGLVDNIPELNNQTRFVTARLGVADPLDLQQMRLEGAYSGLSKAREIGPEGVLKELQVAGLRGRGGAGFPTHFKWRSAMEQSDSIRHVVANADEGDAGTFIDRMLMEGDPHALIEGMLICSEVIDARQGWVYLRSEYPDAKRILDSAIEQARQEGILGDHFDIEVVIGAGSYVCGEETALLESLEGRRGEVRSRPPYPTESGLYGHPTIINNVLTFAYAASILSNGSECFEEIGTESSKGTVVAQIVGSLGKPACVEVPFGGSVRQLLQDHSDISGVHAVQIGGPLGSVFKVEELEQVEVSFEGLTSAGGLLGHGGFVCYDDTFDAHQEVIGWMEFFRDESCGKCTPCRIGTQRALELLKRIGTNDEMPGDKDLLTSLDEVMTMTSLCALGGLAMNPVRSTMDRWPESFGGDLSE